MLPIKHALDILQLDEGIIAHESSASAPAETAVALLQKSNEHFISVLRSCPDNATVHNFRGILLRRMGKLAEAQASYAAALAFTPEFPEAWTNLAALYTGDVRNRLLQRSLVIDPAVRLPFNAWCSEEGPGYPQVIFRLRALVGLTCS